MREFVWCVYVRVCVCMQVCECMRMYMHEWVSGRVHMHGWVGVCATEIIKHNASIRGRI